MCSGLSRRASRPACTPGWRVLMRPSIISGKPVRSVTGWASTAASERTWSVVPVAYSSKPSRRRPRAKPASPVLSLTDSRAVGNPLLHHPDRGRHEAVLGLVHSLPQGLGRIAGQDRHRLLHEYRPGVELVG